MNLLLRLLVLCCSVQLVDGEEIVGVCHRSVDEERSLPFEMVAWLNDHTRWSLSEGELSQFETEGSSTFGHATVDGVSALLTEWKRRGGGDSFWDLGSGVGHVVLIGALLDNSSTFTGIELVRRTLPSLQTRISQAASRLQVASRALERFDSFYPELRLKQRVSLHRDDMLRVDLREADALWISNLALPRNTLHALADKLRRELKDGTVLFTSVSLFDDDDDDDTTSFVAPMSWNRRHRVKAHRFSSKSTRSI